MKLETTTNIRPGGGEIRRRAISAFLNELLDELSLALLQHSGRVACQGEIPHDLSTLTWQNHIFFVVDATIIFHLHHALICRHCSPTECSCRVAGSTTASPSTHSASCVHLDQCSSREPSKWERARFGPKHTTPTSNTLAIAHEQTTRMHHRTSSKTAIP